MLFKLADDAAIYVSSAVAKNFDKLPERVRNELLIKIVDNAAGSIEDAVYDAASTVADNFDKLPERVRNELLIKIVDDKDAVYDVASTVADNFDTLLSN